MVNPATVAGDLVSNLGKYWSEVVWPWLEVNRHLTEAAKTLARKNLVAAAAARLVLNERDEAGRLVKDCITDLEHAIQAQSAYPENARLLAARLKSVRDWAAHKHLL